MKTIISTTQDLVYGSPAASPSPAPSLTLLVSTVRVYVRTSAVPTHKLINFEVRHMYLHAYAYYTCVCVCRMLTIPLV